MTRIKFIHTADLHLDTPFKGISNLNNELALKLKDATFKSFKGIIELCLKEKVDFLIISGDIFDSENKSIAAQRRFVSEIKRLSDTGIPTYFICGNHDPLISWLDNDFKLPENVFRFNSSEVGKFTYIKEGHPVADIYGISFEEKVVKKNLAKEYNLEDDPSPVSIALLHGTVGAPGQHENYAPFKVEDVINKGFDYWALGHIHKREIIKNSSTTLVYPGNPQGRDFGESGAKGCMIVEISQGDSPVLKFIPTQIIRFEEVGIDLSGEDDLNKLFEKIEDAKLAIRDFDANSSYILRINLFGKTSLHSMINNAEELKQLVDTYNEDQMGQDTFVWIDNARVNTQPLIDIETIKMGNNFPAEILKTFENIESDKNKLSQNIQDLEKDFSSNNIKRELAVLSDEDKKEILEKAKWFLLDKMIKS